MQELINKIMQKAIEISQNTETKIFIEYLGSVDSITICFRSNSEAELRRYENIYLDWNNAKEKLEKTFQRLENLEKTAERRK